jgi:hypothetical protein
MAFAVPCALILCLVAALHVPAADSQWALYKSGRSLDVSLLYIDPCYQEANDSVQHLNTSLWAVTTNYTYCRNGDATTSKQALQIKTKVLSNGSLTFVVRDERNIQSWKLPLKLPEYFTTFTTAYYTLCNTMLPDDTVRDYVAYIDTFTGSSDPVDYSIEVTAVDQFILKYGTFLVCLLIVLYLVQLEILSLLVQTHHRWLIMSFLRMYLVSM